MKKTLQRWLLTALAAVAIVPAAQAEGRLRIAEQFGIVYLLLNVAQDQKLIEKHGKAQGVDIQVEFVRLSGGGAVNDALLSGQIDIGGAGVGPLLTLWDRTLGKQNVRGVASLGNFPYYLVTNNPAVKSIADFTDKDRIATPAVGISVQSRVLQLASSRLWGDAQWNRLDKLQVALPHPEATAAMIKGGTEVTAHFGNPPFQNQSLAANPNVRVVLKSYDVLGGPSSATVLYATEKFRNENPKTYKAFIAALDEAAKFITANPEGAADSYLRTGQAGIDRTLLLSIIRSPEVQFKLTPQNTYALADFMFRIGAIKNKPASARDYFFDDAHAQGGKLMLAFDGVSLEYAAGARVVRATHRVSLEVHDAERYVLLGPSGCGKSTLLKAAAGFIAPREGTITLDGAPVQGPGPDRMVVFQEFDQLPPWKTVLGNVMFPLLASRRFGSKEAERRAREAVAMVGLADFVDEHPHRLSGGMKQRVAIARALAMQPRVLLMDEPFAALDALTRRRMQQELLQLWDGVRFTLLFVTHSIEEALLVGSRIGVLTPRPGRLRAEFNAHEFDFTNAGGADFQQRVDRIHDLLFDEAVPA